MLSNQLRNSHVPSAGDANHSSLVILNQSANNGMLLHSSIPNNPGRVSAGGVNNALADLQNSYLS